MKNIFTGLGLIILLILLIFVPVNAQTFTNYTTANISTLCNNYINSIKIDAQGNKWFGTENGISRFDGTTWTTYTTANGLIDNGITAIAIDGKGNKWFGTSNGVSKFDGTTWTSFTTKDGLVSNFINAISIDNQGNEWFGTNGGISKFDGTTWTTFTTADGLVENYVNAIDVDSKGNIWIGTHVSGVSKFDGTTWTNYSDGLAYGYITSISSDAQGNVWVGFREYDAVGSGGVSKFDGTKWTTYTIKEGLSNNNVNAIAFDDQGDSWVGTDYSVSKFDGTTWKNYGLEGNEVKAIAIDTQGNKWFGTNGAGVWKLDATPWPYNDIVPNGSIVTKLSSNQYVFNEGPVWYNDSVLLFVDDGIGAPDIFQYNPVGKQFSKWPTNSPHCTGLTLDKDGNLIGVSSNIVMINKDGQGFKTIASEYNNKPFNNPNDLIADKKGGIYFTDPDFFLTTPPQDKTAVYYIDPTGNVKRVIDDLAKPNGLVLSPDGTRLYVVDTKVKYLYSWTVASDGSVSGKSTLAELDTVNGGNNYADGMAVDIHGNIYLATNTGIQIFSPQGVAITTIAVSETPSNCDFGGKDFKTLYITAQTNLYSIDLNYPGYAVSRKDMPNGVNPESNQPLVDVYPNPVSDFLNIRHNLGKLNSIDLLTIEGKKQEIQLDKKNGNDFVLNTQRLKSGIYLLYINYTGGILTRKFVKK